MSFVARRFGSAGIFSSSENAALSSVPPPMDSGVSLRRPVALIVGVDDDVAALCKRAALSASVAFVRVSQGIAACRAIRDARPSVVVIAPTLWRDERNAIMTAAEEAGARVIELPPFAPPSWVARQLVRAATDEPMSATG